MQIRYNTSAAVSINLLKVNDKKLSESTGRLSSGLKINKAKDNPAGLAMARRMNAQITSMEVADNSAKDGINIIKTADGVLSEIHDMLQRMNELAVKASNGTLQDEDRQVIQDEITQLKDEITRISESTDFNGQRLLDGTFDYRGYATVGGQTNPDFKVSTYSDRMEAGKYEIDLGALGLSYDKDTNRLTDGSGKDPDSVQGNPVTVEMVKADGSKETVADMTVKSIDGDIIKIGDPMGREISLRLRNTPPGTLEVDLTGAGAMTVQIGANEGQTLDIRIPEISLSNLGIFNTYVTEDGRDPKDTMGINGQTASQMAISEISDAIKYVSELRARLGAYQNRLEHTDSNLQLTGENMTAAYSQIMDVDMAEEMSEYSTQQVLSQAGISVLSQANERPSSALQLLQ